LRFARTLYSQILQVFIAMYSRRVVHAFQLLRRKRNSKRKTWAQAGDATENRAP